MSSRVLVVDDEPQVTLVLSEMLRQEGYDVWVAHSAVDALVIWEANQHIGIVLTDLKLNDRMDGISLCSRIRYEDPRTVVMAMTGWGDEYTLAYCRGVGFTDVLIKPVDYDDLMTAMRCASHQRGRWKEMP